MMITNMTVAVEVMVVRCWKKETRHFWEKAQQKQVRVIGCWDITIRRPGHGVRARKSSGENTEDMTTMGVDEGDYDHNYFIGVNIVNEADALHGGVCGALGGRTAEMTK